MINQPIKPTTKPNEFYRNTKEVNFIELDYQILIAMVLGAILGVVIHTLFRQISLIFSNKILATANDKMFLVFTTLVVGIAKLGNVSAVGRIGGKASWFFTAFNVSIVRNVFCKCS
jgi:Na+/H+-dicarboxylate symporter